jgi:hypothetical protein
MTKALKKAIMIKIMARFIEPPILLIVISP